MKKYDFICSECHGLVAKPNTLYGYSGHFCECQNPTPVETINALSGGGSKSKDKYTFANPEDRQLYEEGVEFGKKLGREEEQERQMNLRLKEREDLMNYLSECRKISVENNRGLWIAYEDLKKFLEG